MTKEAIIMKKISQKQGKVDLRGQRCYVGVDVHKSTYYTALLSEEGLRKEFSSPANPQALIDQIHGMGVEIIALAHETGPTGYELAWSCQEAGIPVVVAATTKIPRKITAEGKTDRLDGIKLSEYLARDMLYGITIPTREEHGLRELERRRQQLVHSRRELRQQIKSFLLKNRIPSPQGLEQWTQSSIEELEKVTICDVNLRSTLDSYLRQLQFVCMEVASIRKELFSALSAQGKDVLVKNLRTIPGVGETVSQCFAAEIFRPERFARAEEICAYVGLAPVTSQSGQGKARARLCPVGQKYLRSILVESAWILIRKDAYYRKVYNKIVARSGLPQKAIVAVARRLLVIMWRLSVEQRVYRFQSRI
jgi:transposase